ncbi:MAG: HNH endonuclease, partial [Acidobacteria bacterium]|nr:HNH endonuclease [Acidobacteriota bacterium]
KAEWRYTVTDPDTTQVIHTGTTTRRPTTALKRYVQAAYRHCVFPGCRMPSADCDLDHTVAVKDGGPTTENNLAPLCRHHHRAKHQAPWKPRRLPNGDHQFTSPLGHTYITSGRSP